MPEIGAQRNALYDYSSFKMNALIRKQQTFAKSLATWRQKSRGKLEDTMPKHQISNSESEESESEEQQLSQEEEEIPKQQEEKGISEYEKKRLSRIAENIARMEALGLSKIASSLMGSSPNSSKFKGKRKVVNDDEDYMPNDDDKLDGGGDDDDDEEEEFPGSKTPRSRKSKVKNKGSKCKKQAHVQKKLSSSDYIDNDDELMKAIALSLKESGEVLPTDVQDAEIKGNARSKKKKTFTSRTQITEDEMVVNFCQFDEAGKGSISMRDVRRMATAHDFMWSDKELADMIHCFDSDGDGKLNLDDFRKIVSRCNMLRTSDNS